MHDNSNILFKNDDLLYKVFEDSKLRKIVRTKDKYFTPSKDYVYMLKRGLLKVYVTDDDGNEKFLWILGKGSIIPRFGSRIIKRLYILSDTELMMIAKPDLPQLFVKHTGLLDIFMHQIYTRYDAMLHTFMNANSKSSEERLLELLYEVGNISSEDTLNVQLKNYLTRQDMAYYVGAHITNISKFLNKFESEGLIRRSGREIIITNIHLLEKYIH